MARHFFGLGPADFAMQAVGNQLNLVASATGTAWDALTGGSPLTDLQDSSFHAITTITADGSGRIGFYGPDGVSSLYVDFGFGRFLLVASDLGALVDANTTGKLDKSGGTMTGALTLSADPAAALQPATKQYVDAADTAEAITRAAAVNALLPKAGGTMTGPIVLSADPAAPLQPATKQYADAILPGFEVLPFSYTGILSVRTGTVRLYNDTGRTRTLGTARASAGVSPAGAAIIVNVKKNGTTIFTSKPTIADGGTTGTATPTTTSWAAGEYLTVDIDQVGSTTPGSDLLVSIAVS